jgi:predicted DNA-binding antitoxin AbrB/MazE fold protein
MAIAARFENGVFKPLEAVSIPEGALAEVYLRDETPVSRRRPSLRELGIAGMWADRDDIGDGIEYENRLRDHPRSE